MAYRTYLRVGKGNHLNSIRNSLDNPGSKEGTGLGPKRNMDLLGEFGSTKDIVRLKKYFKTKHNVEAAQAIIRILDRKNSKSK